MSNAHIRNSHSSPTILNVFSHRSVTFILPLSQNRHSTHLVGGSGRIRTCILFSEPPNMVRRFASCFSIKLHFHMGKTLKPLLPVNISIVVFSVIEYAPVLCLSTHENLAEINGAFYRSNYTARRRSLNSNQNLSRF